MKGYRQMEEIDSTKKGMLKRTLIFLAIFIIPSALFYAVVHGPELYEQYQRDKKDRKRFEKAWGLDDESKKRRAERDRQNAIDAKASQELRDLNMSEEELRKEILRLQLKELRERQSDK